MTQEDPQLRNAKQDKQSLSSKILAFVLSGDYQLAVEVLESYPSNMNIKTKDKLIKVFKNFKEFRKLPQKKDEHHMAENQLQLNAIVDRYEATLYDMGDLASEDEDGKTRIYLTIMAERLVELAKQFNDQHINNRMTVAMPSSLMNSAARINLLNHLYSMT